MRGAQTFTTMGPAPPPHTHTPHTSLPLPSDAGEQLQQEIRAAELRHTSACAVRAELAASGVLRGPPFMLQYGASSRGTAVHYGTSTTGPLLLPAPHTGAAAAATAVGKGVATRGMNGLGLSKT